MRKYSLFIAFIILLAACKGSQKISGQLSSSHLVADGKLWSSLFQQRAAEYQALCLQAFNIARLRTDQALQQPSAKPRAIITDIDETFLDNSPYAVHQALAGKDYEAASWYEWTAKGIADTLTGGLAFFTYAASKGIEIFYVTNREEPDRAGTLANLQRFRFPFADNQHLVLRKDVSTKEPRRQEIARNYEISLLLGDTRGDFSPLFDKKSVAERAQNVQSLATEFGKKFIVLPNANYGGWEDAIYLNKRDWSPAQKDSLIKAVLKAY